MLVVDAIVLFVDVAVCDFFCLCYCRCWSMLLLVRFLNYVVLFVDVVVVFVVVVC